MVVREIGALVKIFGLAYDPIRVCASSSRYQVNDAIQQETLVVVHVPRRHDEARPRLRGSTGQEFGQGPLIGPAVVAGVAIGLHVNHGRMVEVEKHEAHRGGQTGELASQPGNLRAVRKQRRIAVEVENVNGVAQLYRVPPAAAQFREGAPPVLETSLLISMKFVVAERRVDAEMRVAPGLRLG